MTIKNAIEVCELAQSIVDYCAANNLKGKARDRAAHAIAWGAYTVADAQGLEHNYSGLTFLLGIRGYRGVEWIAMEKPAA